MLLEIEQIISVKHGKENFFWALLPARQLVPLNNSKELATLINADPDFRQNFKLLGESVDIVRWNLEKETKLAAPMNDILLFAKILVSERNRIYPLISNVLENLKITFKEKWIFPQKRNFYRFLFSHIYESWKYSESVVEEIESKIFEKFCSIWSFPYKFSDFKKWLETETKFYLKVVGEEFHLDISEIKKLKIGEKLNLMTDPLNKHDSQAIGVYLINGKQIGFLRRTVSSKLFSRLINQNSQVSIIHLDSNAYKNNRIFIELELKTK